MNQQEKIKDWYVRYHLIFSKRYTRKQKDRFLNSLYADLSKFRGDIKLDTFKLSEKDKNEYRNLYVGDINRADKIICTYYDTPSVRFGPYHFFDTEHRIKRTTTFILFSSIIYIIMGLLFTLFVAIPVFQSNGLASLPFISCIIFFIVYFYFLGKITRGWPRKSNLVQNTSSVLLLMNCIASLNTKRVAFAFLDAGSTSNKGLERLMNERNRADFYLLDSIGSEKPLYQVNPELNQFELIDSVDQAKPLNSRLVYIISGDQVDNQFVLSRNDLKRNELNDQNMNNTYSFLERVIRREFK